MTTQRFTLPALIDSAPHLHRDFDAARSLCGRAFNAFAHALS